MKKESLNKEFIMNVLRLRGSLTISQLADAIKVTRPTIYLHLDSLEKQGLIRRNKDPKKKGAPVTIELVEDSVKKKDMEDLIRFLKMIELNKGLTMIQLKEKQIDNKERVNWNSHMTATFEGLIDKKIFLTDKGKQFLRENENKRI